MMKSENPVALLSPTIHDAMVFVVDDDAAVRTALDSLLRSVGWRVTTFASATEFLLHVRPPTPACLILDVRLPGLSGLDLQRALQDMQDRLPVIMITGHGDIPMSVRAMKGGAHDFLIKPFEEEDLLQAVAAALIRDTQRRLAESTQDATRGAYQQLTAREREVLALVLQGKLNKQIAATLNVSEITVKVHRRHLMQKMRVRSVAELARDMERLHNTAIGAALYQGVIGS